VSIDEVEHFKLLGSEILARGGSLYIGQKEKRLLDANRFAEKRRMRAEETLRNDETSKKSEKVDYSSLKLEDL